MAIIDSMNRSATELAVQLRRAGAWRAAVKTPVFLHFSDIHNDPKRLSRILEYFQEHQGWIEDMIHTGDAVPDRFSDGLPVMELPGAGRILNVIGNHDSLNSETGYDYTVRPAQAEMYGQYFQPFLAENRAVMEENTTYWYKDYNDYGLRLIGLDAMLREDPAQLSWLERVLEEALSAKKCVIAACHFPPANAEVIPCNYSSLTREYTFEGIYSELSERVQERVARFIKAGGEFICYLCGHAHADYLRYNKNYPDQLFVVVDTANVDMGNEWSDTFRVEGTRSEDLFNLFSYDTQHKFVRVVRVGADADCCLRKKQTLCVNYKTMKIITEG